MKIEINNGMTEMEGRADELLATLAFAMAKVLRENAPKKLDDEALAYVAKQGVLAALRRLDKAVIDLKDASIDTTMAEQLLRQYKSRGGGEA